MVRIEDEKKATAYHEAGHALVSLHVEHNDPLHKVTIIPRGRALGVTWNLPERDRYSQNMKQMKARLALCFGGRIAEQLIYGKDELNTGASNDIQQATDMARSRSEEHPSELQSLMRSSYAGFCLTKKKQDRKKQT